MKVLNYDIVLKTVPKNGRNTDYDNIRIHKKHNPSNPPKVSIILLDWSCRERFNTLDWLGKQDVSRDNYELIWVELYNRIIPEAFEKADTFITCGHRGIYNKHVGYNIGLLNSNGQIIVVCDSDAVYPPDFVSSVLKSFYPDNSITPQPLVLMHYELRTSFPYPDNLRSADELKDEKWQWWPVNPNAGACMSVRKKDAVRFGGFDEHKTFNGYLCGPYDLGWRLVNAGIPERWHDMSTVLWHFAHPDPVGVNGIIPTLKLMRESTHPHVDLHALAAVEALSTGRFQPLKENPEIFRLRMKDRQIGTEFEKKYAVMTGQKGFSQWQVFRLRISMFFDMVWTAVGENIYHVLRAVAKRLLSEKQIEYVRYIKRRWFIGRDANEPFLVNSYKNFNIILYHNTVYGLPQSIGPVDFRDEKQITHPAIVKGNTIRKVKRLINKADPSVLIPRLEKSYRGYNIVKYRKLIFAIPQSIGHVDLNNEKRTNNPDILQSHSNSQIKKLIDRHISSLESESRPRKS
ncbi:MAG: glycosyltransferase [Sedimentisphaerales bacterium]